MRFWRVAVGANSGLDGEGARLYGGRWNSEGTAIVYAATHLSLAVLEVLVHVPPQFWPERATAFTITLPDDAVVENPEQEAGGAENVDQRRHFGDAWIAAGKAQAVIVPSMIIPLGFGPVATGEANALLNPRFATSWRVTQAPFQLDDRLRRPA